MKKCLFILLVVCSVSIANASSFASYQVTSNALICSNYFYSLKVSVQPKDENQTGVKVGDLLTINDKTYEIKKMNYSPGDPVGTVEIITEQTQNGAPFSFKETFNIIDKKVVSTVLELYNQNGNDNCSYALKDDSKAFTQLYFTKKSKFIILN